MTISSNSMYAVHTGSGTGPYTFSFPIFATSDLEVITRVTATGVEDTLTLTTDYTVDWSEGDSTGSITLTSSLAATSTLIIRRVRPVTQTTDIRNQGDFYPESHENALDHQTMLHQQHDEAVNRCLRAPKSEPTADMELPSSVDRASQYLIFDSSGNPTVASTAISGSTPVSAFGATLVDDANAAAAQTTLGISAYAQTILDDANAATARATLGFGGSGAPVGDVDFDSTAVSSNGLYNYSIAVAMDTPAAGEMTVTLQTQAAATPSATSPVKAVFRSSTLTSGVYSVGTATAATSVVIDATSTLGHSSGNAHYVYVYAINNSGTIEAAVSSSILDEGIRHTTTAESASSGGTADSRSALYSTTSRADVPIRLLGRFLSTQATAGTWTTAASEITAGTSFLRQVPHLCYTGGAFTGNTSIAGAGTAEIVPYTTKVLDTHNMVTTGASWSATIPMAGTYYVFAGLSLDGGGTWTEGNVLAIHLHVNNSGTATMTLGRSIQTATHTTVAYTNGGYLLSFAAGDTFDIRATQNSGDTINFATSGASVLAFWVSK